MKKKWFSVFVSVLVIFSMMPAMLVQATSADGATYYTELEGPPNSWNPHTWVDAIDMVMLEYVVTPLVANYKDDGGETVYAYEAATAVTDITADFADKELWGIDEDAGEGFVFQIDLNPLLTWEDGTPIDADTYIYSMQALLDASMANYRISRYYKGDESIRGAFGYYNRDKAGQDMYIDAVDADIDDDTVIFINPDEYCYFFDNSWQYYHDSYFYPYFIADDGEDIYEKYATGEYIEVTDEIMEDLIGLAGIFGDTNPDAWLEFCAVYAGEYADVSWEEVGLYKTGDYQIIYITENPMGMPSFLSLMKRNWIVNEGAYEAGKETADGVTVTGYNTGSGTTVSFGPYKLASFEDAGIVLEKNENWYGWDGEIHPGLFTYEEFGDYDAVVIEVWLEEDEEGVELIEGSGDVHPFPFAFETEDLYGNVVTQDDLGEKEIFFVHLWATWCGPCVSEMGEIAKIAHEYGDAVGFLGLVLDYDTNLKGAVKLVEYNDIPFTNIFAKIEELDGLYQMVKSGYVPTTILIDGEGNIIGDQIVGSYEEGYIRFINEALNTVRGQ